jgi:hypothetical protein
VVNGCICFFRDRLRQAFDLPGAGERINKIVLYEKEFCCTEENFWRQFKHEATASEKNCRA